MRLFSTIGTKERRLLATLAVVFGCLTLSPDGVCQSEERIGARAAAIEGARAFSEKRWVEAIDYFKRAESLVHAPPHLLYMGRAQVEAGFLVEARENFLAIIHEELKPDAPQVFRNAKEGAATDIKAVEARMPYATVTIKGDAPRDIALMQDGVRIPSALIGIPRPVNPGSHKFEATGKGVAGSALLQIKDSERQKVVIELMPSSTAVAPPPVEATPAPVSAEPSPSAPATAPPTDQAPPDGGGKKMNGLRIGSFVGFGVGAVGIAMGTIFTLKASSKQKEGDQLFSDNNCGAEGGCPDQRGQIDELDSQRKSAQTLGLVGFIAGGVGVATGVTLFILSSSKASAPASARRDGPTLNVGVGPSSVLLTGKF